MKTIEVMRAVSTGFENHDVLVTFAFCVGLSGDLELETTSANVWLWMEVMDWVQGRAYVAELDYQKDQAYQLALEQLETANES